jgi:hypothetical protein
MHSNRLQYCLSNNSTRNIMERTQLFSMALAAATLGLTACGGNDGVATTTTPGATGTTTVVVTAAAVACEAPDVDADLAYGSSFSSVCVPASSSASSRYDAAFYGNNSSVFLYKVDFANATCTGNGTSNAFAQAVVNFASATTTVASLGTDGVTQVTGSGRTVTLTMFGGEGQESFPAGTPLLGNGAYVLCKSTPSTTAMRTISSFNSQGQTYTFTPSFSLKASNVGTSNINTGFGFDGVFQQDF